MPEGPEIRRTADRIAEALVDHCCQRVWFGLARLKTFEGELSGRRVCAVTPKGKALLITFDNQRYLYSHNQLYGKWWVGDPIQAPATQRQLRAALYTKTQAALLYSASDIAVLDEQGVAEHPFLARLGPDALAQSTDVEAVLGQLASPQHARRRLAGLLLDQRFMGGLGNYLRSEILFVAALSPHQRPCDLNGAERRRLAQAILDLSRQSYRTGGITNDLERAAALKAQGVPYGEYRHWVFSREGRPCSRCGAAIVKVVAAGRRLYRCSNCQPSAAARGV